MPSMHVSFNDEKVTVSVLERRMLTALAEVKYEASVAGLMLLHGNSLSGDPLYDQAVQVTNKWLRQLFGDLGIKIEFSA